MWLDDSGELERTRQIKNDEVKSFDAVWLPLIKFLMLKLGNKHNSSSLAHFELIKMY